MYRFPLAVNAISLALLVLACSNTLAQPGDSQAVRRTGTRMAIYEAPPSTVGQSNYFTIVGAVKRSAVYSSDESVVTLQDLISAAGGLTEFSNKALKITRNGATRIHCYESSSLREVVFAGEVVVASATQAPPRQYAALNEESATTPIVCLGLADRPVVLPLHERIQDINLLSRQLLQPVEAVRSAVVIHPQGRSGGARLVPGMIVVFDPNTIDQLALRTALGQEPFPPALPLKQSAKTTQSNSNLEAYPGNAGSEPVRDDNLAPPAATSLAGQSHRGSASERVPTLAEPLFGGHAPSVQAADAVMADAVMSEAELAPSDPFPVSALVAGDAQGIGDFPTHFSSGNQVQPPGPPRGTTSATASWVYADVPETPEAPIDAPSPPVLKSETTLMSSQTTKAELDLPRSQLGTGNNGRYWPIVLGVALLTIGCFALSLYWSRLEAKLLTQQASPSPTPIAPPATTASHTPSDSIPIVPLEQLLSTQPVVEEQVAVPADVPLHGEAVGHRRHIVHEAHSQLQGPHFSRTAAQPRDSITVERELRNAFRNAVAAGSTTHVEEADSPDQIHYDIVQPELGADALDAPLDGTSLTASTDRGVLDRILRSQSEGKPE